MKIIDMNKKIKFAYYFSLMLILFSCKDGQKANNRGVILIDQDSKVSKDTLNLPKLYFMTEVYNFGEIKEGTLLFYTFKLQNLGKSPLIISDVETSCGCTTAYWPNKPILPKGLDSIKFFFNTQGKEGLQDKKVLVFSNSIHKAMVLSITGKVEK